MRSMPSWLRRFRFCLLLFTVAASVVVSGCSGCSEEPCAGACLEGEECIDGVCTPVDACPDGCAEGEICEAGECITPQPQCAAVGDDCDRSRPVNDGFYCLDVDGAGPGSGSCVEFCAADGSCPTGSLCFFLESTVDPACTSSEDCDEGRECQSGACRRTICNPSECEGFLEGRATCDSLYGNAPAFSDGSQCYDVGNGARYCYPAGPKQAGESCGDTVAAIQAQDFSNTCASGLACVDNVCQTACADNEDCSGDAQCLLADQDLVAEGVGFCGETCTPFETGSCGDGETCLPVAEGEGICTDAGEKQAFETCRPGEGDCVDGTVCVSYQQADPTTGTSAIARCQPICDITAGPPNDNGIVGEFAQSQRDATCPQSEEVGAFVRFVNLAETAGAIDVYLDDEQTPAVTDLQLGERSDSDEQTAGSQFLELDGASHDITVLPSGAPSTDPPLHETTLQLGAEDAREVLLLPVVGSPDDVDSVTRTPSRDDVTPAGGKVALQIIHGVVDAGAIDVIAVPEGDDLSDPANQTELGTALELGDVSTPVELDPGTVDILAFDAGAMRDDRTNAVLTLGSIALVADESSTGYLRGTVDPDDIPVATGDVVPYSAAPAIGASGPRYTCVDLENGVFGYCQQKCAGPEAYGTGVCEGESMGCKPVLVTGPLVWQDLCGPVGEGQLGDACNPFAEYGQCGAGLYCLEYGNTAEGLDTGSRGKCTNLCVEEDADHPVLSCPSDQSCKPISYEADYQVGECGFSCEPDASYTDGACPSGLRSCKPIASQQEDLGAQGDAPPIVEEEQPFCSASGDVAEGEICSGADCVPGTECMFPRSRQSTFVATMLSPYFGAMGQTPRCTPQCDPFDGDDSSVTCESGETCLFNFPWSAEVGHCAPIVEDVQPNLGCERPGEACGDDSICVVNNGANICFRFCQYTGGDAPGVFDQSTCPTGLQCTPLINDIGVCLEP